MRINNVDKNIKELYERAMAPAIYMLDSNGAKNYCTIVQPPEESKLLQFIGDSFAKMSSHVRGIVILNKNINLSGIESYDQIGILTDRLNLVDHDQYKDGNTIEHLDMVLLKEYKDFFEYDVQFWVDPIYEHNVFIETPSTYKAGLDPYNYKAILALNNINKARDINNILDNKKRQVRVRGKRWDW